MAKSKSPGKSDGSAVQKPNSVNGGHGGQLAQNINKINKFMELLAKVIEMENELAESENNFAAIKLYPETDSGESSDEGSDL